MILTFIMFPGSFSAELGELDLQTSPRYSSFNRDNEPPAATEFCETTDQWDAIYDNVVVQMEMYDQDPLAFVHPSPHPA